MVHGEWHAGSLGLEQQDTKSSKAGHSGLPRVCGTPLPAQAGAAFNEHNVGVIFLCSREQGLLIRLLVVVRKGCFGPHGA